MSERLQELYDEMQDKDRRIAELEAQLTAQRRDREAMKTAWTEEMNELQAEVERLNRPVVQARMSAEKQVIAVRDWWNSWMPQNWVVGGWTYRDTAIVHQIGGTKIEGSVDLDYSTMRFLRALGCVPGIEPGDISPNEANRRRIAELEARLDAVNNIKYETHPSWNCSDDFNSGWKACRELVRDVQALGGDDEPYD